MVKWIKYVALLNTQTTYKHLLQFPHFTLEHSDTESSQVDFCKDLTPNSMN